jgi:hypothetical protein
MQKRSLLTIIIDGMDQNASLIPYVQVIYKYICKVVVLD